MVDNELRAEQIVKLMEKKGWNLEKFMMTIKSWSVNNTVELGYLMILLHSDYSFLSDEDQRVIIWMILNKEGKIDIVSLE